MHVRPFAQSDLPRLIELTIETFRPFYEGYVLPLFGEELFQAHHGQWEQDYRDEVPTLNDPPAGRHVAVAEVDQTIAGYVAWKIGERTDHGEIDLLAVSSSHRRQRAGRELCLHAIAQMKAVGVEVVEIGTGSDPFHAAARGLYESLGFTKVLIAGYLKKV